MRHLDDPDSHSVNSNFRAGLTSSLLKSQPLITYLGKASLNIFEFFKSCLHS